MTTHEFAEALKAYPNIPLVIEDRDGRRTEVDDNALVPYISQLDPSKSVIVLEATIPL